MVVDRISTPYSEFRKAEDILLVNILWYMLDPSGRTTLASIKKLAAETDRMSPGLFTGRSKWHDGIPPLVRAIEFIRVHNAVPPPVTYQWFQDLRAHLDGRVVPEDYKGISVLQDVARNFLMTVKCNQFLANHKIPSNQW
jgi:hypothetical protein